MTSRGAVSAYDPKRTLLLKVQCPVLKNAASSRILVGRELINTRVHGLPESAWSREQPSFEADSTSESCQERSFG
jgi:hypothetical protein